jgi:hypothetical protein
MFCGGEVANDDAVFVGRVGLVLLLLSKPDLDPAVLEACSHIEELIFFRNVQ